MYYDRQGNKITQDEWGKKHREDYEKIVIKTTVGKYEISTVWLGLDHGWNKNDAPMIFETMVFPIDGMDDVDCVRYTTEEEAIEGHLKLLRKYKEVESVITRMKEEMNDNLPKL